MDLESAFSIIFAATGSVFSLGLIGKMFTNIIASRVIKKYELVNLKTLEKEKQEYQKEIESLKSELSKLQKEHEIAFSSTYKKREELIITLYELLNGYLDICWSNIEERNFNEIRIKFEALTDFYNKNCLYFPASAHTEIYQVLLNAGLLLDTDNVDEYVRQTKKLTVLITNMADLFRCLLKVQ